MTIDPGRLKVIVPGIIEESEGTYFYLTQADYPVATSMYKDGNTALIDGADAKLDEADAAAKSDPVRLSHEEVFGNVRAQFRGRK